MQNSLSNPQPLLLKMLGGIEDYAILLLDKLGNVASLNKGAEKIKGYSSDEIIGHNFRIFYTDEALKNKVPELLLEKALLKGKAQHRGWRVKKDGKTFWAHVTITTIYDEQNEVIGFCKFTRDLTDKLNAEKALREYARLLEFRNKELEQFVYIASHDLQEPLLTVNNFVGLLKKEYGDQFDENGALYLKYISESTEKMRYLIKGLLDYARLGTPAAKEPVNCNFLVESVKQELSNQIAATGMTIQYDNLPVVYGYAAELKQLFHHLISNSLKFRKKDILPEVQIRATEDDQYWNFDFSDNGIGIEAQYKEKIFSIFQRLHSHEDYEGHGIGLSHCKKIVELHGGEIFVKSVVNQGSTFCFSLKSNIYQ